MNITTLFQDQANRHPHQIAIIDSLWGRDRQVSFADLAQSSAKAATFFQRLGLKPGDVVLVFYPMSAELYTILGGLFRLGLVAMFLDPSAGREHIDRGCETCHPQAVIMSPKAALLQLRSPRLRRIPLKISVGFPLPGTIPWSRIQAVPPYGDQYACSADTPALLTFTSGSTGQPKATLRTHGFLRQQYQALATSLQLAEDQGAIQATALPIFVLANLAAGVTSLIPQGNLRYPGTIAPRPILRQLQTYGVSRLVASPALLQQVADYCLPRQITLPHLRRLYSGGAPVMPALLQQLRHLCPQASLTVLYGSTEAEPIAQLSHTAITPQDYTAMATGQGLLVGTPVPSIQLAIVPQRWGSPITPVSPAEFRADTLPVLAIGEIVVSGDHVLTSYWQGQGDQATKVWVGEAIWHRTGDAGYVDHHGRLWLMGRCQAQIQDIHGTLYPFAVECIARQYPSIRHAAVISVQNSRVLLLELKQPTRWADRLQTLASLKVALAWANIQRIQCCDRLPVDRRHNGKILYDQLPGLVLAPNSLTTDRLSPTATQQR